MKLTLLLFATILQAQTWPRIIDSGSPSDSNFTGGATTDITVPAPGVTDLTSRYGTFRYDIPADNVPYLITFRWIEKAVTAAGQRTFQVRINQQIFFDQLDLYKIAGFLKPLSRTVIAVGSDNLLKIEFITQVRAATISSLEIVPLFQIYGLSAKACNQAVNPGKPKSDCTGLYLFDLPWQGSREKFIGIKASAAQAASGVFQ